MRRTALLGVVFLLAAGTGCRSCGERHPLWDRLTGHDRDSAAPSRFASNADPACGSGCATLGQPVSYGLSTPVPTGGFMPPTYPEGTPYPIGPAAPGRSDELPPPGNIPATNLPATPSPAIPMSGSAGGAPARVTAEPRGK